MFKESQLPTIKYNRYSGFEVDLLIPESMSSITGIVNKTEYHFSDEERVQLILLLLLSKTEDLSLIHLKSELNVSRNTVLQDLKKAKEKAACFSCTLEYSRRCGYFLKGDEWDIRLLLNNLISEIASLEQGEFLLEYPLSAGHCKLVGQVQMELEKIEEALQIRYIDERLAALPYEIVYTCVRIQTGNCLMRLMEEWEKAILSSEEYRVLTDLFKLLDLMRANFVKERAYLAIQLLIANRIVGDILTNQLDEKLFQLSCEVIQQFETLACVQLHDEKKLAKQLFQHLKPAYYRAKFHIKLTNPLYETVVQEQPELHHLVKKAMKPFVLRLDDCSLSEDEYAYVTMHFGGWLERQGTELASRFKAVVVCPKGVAVSKLLIHRLKDIFPEILFLDTLSLREFYAYPLSYDIVFSTVFVRTKARLYLVKPNIDFVEKKLLYREVMQSLYGFSVSNLHLDQLIREIRSHATIHDQAALKQALCRFFSRHKFGVRIRKEQEKPVLEDLITKDTIQFAKEIPDWEEAIRFAAKPLLKNKSIQSSYVDAMIQNVRKEGPYVVITPKVAIPHARPEDGVHVLSMSLLVLEKSTYFSPMKPVNLIFVLAAVDNKTHLKALSRLTELLSSEKMIERIIALKDKEKVMKIIHYYSKGDEMS